MDTTDPEITFGSDGVCNHCCNFDEITSKGWFPNEEGAKRLSVILDRIRAAGKNQAYDCIIGLSGGVDSSYILFVHSAIRLSTNTCFNNDRR
jgi:asparagine synthetase B (glutamine-hydrolysing)